MVKVPEKGVIYSLLVQKHVFLLVNFIYVIFYQIIKIYAVTIIIIYIDYNCRPFIKIQVSTLVCSNDNVYNRMDVRVQ